MGRSIDSIGSCSLDADSTDFSDTSESLNFISPSSTREEFTAGIAERTRYGKLQQPVTFTPKLILNQPVNQSSTATTTYFDVNSGKINTIVSRAGGTNGRFFNGLSTESFLSTKTIELQSPTVVSHANKKPSYLNLACCVNGYSNYTNYDSEERKEINKSREVSPNRPIISTLSMSRQQRSSENLLSVPAPVTFVKQSPLTSITKRFASLNLNDKDTTDNASLLNGNGSVANRKSFIQQRVEKLYGTTAILTTTVKSSSETAHRNGNGRMNGSSTASGNSIIEEKDYDEECMNSLPVMKHLRPEFAKQLQFMNSPKKSVASNGHNFKLENSSTGNDNGVSLAPNKPESILIQSSNSELKSRDIVVKDDLIVPSPVKIVEKQMESFNKGLESINEKSPKTLNKPEMNNCDSDKSSVLVKDGKYFLEKLKAERTRILNLAEQHEIELNKLQGNPSTVLCEEMNGIVLAAIGKARLLATKKFKQFEGLCEENLNPTSDGPQTLTDDLQGFWEMMQLQVDDINNAFREIEKYRDNGWVKTETPLAPPPKGSRLTKRPLTQSQTAKAKSVVPVKKPSTAPSDAAQKREELRKQMLEMKRKHKAAMMNGDTSETGNIICSSGKENEENVL